jgi:hypothetical protein
MSALHYDFTKLARYRVVLQVDVAVALRRHVAIPQARARRYGTKLHHYPIMARCRGRRRLPRKPLIDPIFGIEGTHP